MPVMPHNVCNIMNIYVCVYVMLCMYVCNVCIYIYIYIYVMYGFMYTRLYTYLYMYNVYVTQRVEFRTLIRGKRIVLNTEVVVRWTVCTVGGFMFCGSQLDLWLTARTL
jgi:hypothetical protein